MNNFCLYCTSGNKKEVAECEDRNCPFYKTRRTNLDYQLEEKKVELLFEFDGNIA